MAKSTISLKRCKIWHTWHITIIDTQEVTYGLSLPERHSGHYFALFHRIRTKSQRLKLVTYCLWYGNNISERIYFMVYIMAGLPQLSILLLLIGEQTSHWCQWLSYTQRYVMWELLNCWQAYACWSASGCPVNPRLSPVAPTIRSDPLFRNTYAPTRGIIYVMPRPVDPPRSQD